MTEESRDLLVTGLAVAALAVAIECAWRCVAPMPYAPRLTDLAIAMALYALTIVPALLVGLGGQRVRWLARVLLGAPLVLPAVNALQSLGRLESLVSGRSLALIGGAALAGLGAGALAVRVVRARTLAVSALVVLALGWGSRFRGHAQAPAGGVPNVLLVVLDTTSAAHLSTYGYPRPTSPGLDALARRSLVYRRAVSPAPWTLPAHASIFSGRYPSELGFDGTGFHRALPGSIASDLAGRGWATAALSANPVVTVEPALRDGFGAVWKVQDLIDSVPLRGLASVTGGKIAAFQGDGDRVTDLALDWVDRLAPAGRPWFLFLNYIDPHCPYRPPRREREALAPGVDPRSVPYDIAPLNLGQVPLTDELRAALVGLYDAEVRHVDAALGRLVHELERRGYGGSNLLLAVTADHGESLGEHGFVGHLLGMPDAVLWVPLLITGPGVAPGEVAAPVQTLQLRATLRALLGLPPLAGLSRALPPWDAAPPLLIAEHPLPQWYMENLRNIDADADLGRWRRDWVAVERDGLKVIFDERGEGASYRLAEDPREERPGPPDAAQALIAAYRAWSRDGHAVAAEAAGGAGGTVSEEKRRALEAMGYLR